MLAAPGQGGMSADETNAPVESKNAIESGMTVWNIQYWSSLSLL